MPMKGTKSVSQDELDEMLARHSQFHHRYNHQGIRGSGRLNLKKRSFRGLSFNKADLSFAIFSRCDFREADLEGCKMGNFNALACNFSNANLRKIQMTVGDLESSKFNGADLSKASISRASGERIEAKGAKFQRTSIGSSYFHVSDFRNSEFTNCKISSVSFKSSYLDGVVIQGGKWRRVEFGNLELMKVKSVEEVDGIGIVHGSVELGDPILAFSGRQGPTGIWREKLMTFPFLIEHLRKRRQNALAAAIIFYRDLVEDWK